MTLRNGTNTAPFTRQHEGTLSASGQTVILYAPNCASATITVDGTFEGAITLTGANVEGGTEGERLLFQSGVGSIGTNRIVGLGQAISREYRILAGGDYIIARASDWTSGSASVRIYAQEAPNIVFINGPVHNTCEEAQRAGRAYSVGTGVASVTSSNFLQARFQNDSDSPRVCFITQRIFTNNRASGATNLELGFFPTYATPLAGATVVAPNNLRPGGNGSSVTFEHRTSTSSLGTPVLGQILPVDGVAFTIEVVRIVSPGQSFAYQIGGAGGGLNNAARIAMAFIWFEEDLQ